MAPTANLQSIEDIILQKDQKNISALRPYLPPDFCQRAAALLSHPPGNVFIVTGFMILSVGKTETDGPPGALAIGQALKKLGHRVYYVTDRYTAPLLRAMTADGDAVIDFPIMDAPRSEAFALDLLKKYQPASLIAIERCGRTADGQYLNMSGKDISAHNAKLDYLFDHHPRTIGIGDGGNEIGMGNLAPIIPQIDRLPKKPTVTPTTQLIIASVSNWGGYGLAAALSKIARRNLLPSLPEERTAIARMVELGAVDGMKGEAVVKVDGFSLDENEEILVALMEWLKEQGVREGLS
jgi:hypothetical protein